MSEFFDDQHHFQNHIGAPLEQQSDAAGVGRAQRSEPERSDGERSGARPTPAPPPSPAPDVAASPEEESEPEANDRQPKLVGRARGRRLVKKDPTPAPALTPEQRLLLLDTWQRSGLPAADFAALVGVSLTSIPSLSMINAWNRSTATNCAGISKR